MRNLPISEITIENGMRLLAKAGMRIDAAFCGKVVKRQFVIRDEILNTPSEEEKPENPFAESKGLGKIVGAL